jgi:hypothetical protein
MLEALHAVVNSGAIQHIGHLVYDAVVTSVQSVASLLDLPVDVSSLESSMRFVKTSGFEDSTVPTVLAPMVGLTIGRSKTVVESVRTSKSNSASSSAATSRIFQTSAAESSSSQVPQSANHPNGGFATVVPRAMFVFLMLDILSLILVRQSWLSPCVKKLGIAQWVLGGVCLGFPMTWLVDIVRKEYSFRAAFVVELVVVFISFLWLCYGGAMIFNVMNACVDSIAPLWWVSYVSSVLSLSLAGTVIFCMVVTTVLSLMYGSASK